MLTVREEAFDLLHKWLAEGTLLECRIGFPILAVRLRGRVRDLFPDAVRFESDDKLSEVRLLLGGEIDFGYGDAGIVDGPNVFRGTLVMIFRLDETRAGADDFVSFAEVDAVVSST